MRLLYRHILLREASDAEVAFQSNALTAGTTRTQLATNFLNTVEFRNGTGPRLTAFLLYSTLLLRDASAGDLAARVGQLQAGMPVQTLVSEFLNTPEFNTLLN